jgi:hypothetical protein
VEDAEKFDPFVESSVEQEILADRETPHAWCEFRAFGTKARVVGEQIQGVIELPHEVVGGVDVVFGNVNPDLDVVPTSRNRAEDAGHGVWAVGFTV